MLLVPIYRGSNELLELDIAQSRHLRFGSLFPEAISV
jgi:hypothetical protein